METRSPYGAPFAVLAVPIGAGGQRQTISGSRGTNSNFAPFAAVFFKGKEDKADRQLLRTGYSHSTLLELTTKGGSD